MKLKRTTKLFIVVTAVTVVIRLLQVMLMTEEGTQFLDGRMTAVSVIGYVLTAVALGLLALNTGFAVRQPKKILCKGIPTAAATAVGGVLICISGARSFISSRSMDVAAGKESFGSGAIFVLAFAAALFAFLLAASAVADYRFPKVGGLVFVVFSVAELIVTYVRSSEKSLRVRTVYEMLAVVGTVLFFLCFGQAVSCVKATKCIRLMYPLGLISSAFCYAAAIPEFLALIFGMSEKVTGPTVVPEALIGCGIIMTALTLSTFRKNNCFRPQSEPDGE